MVQKTYNIDLEEEVVEILATSNVEIEDNLYTRGVKALTIPIVRKP
jgi:hypothetical protein